MENSNKNILKKKGGFALLITIMVVSVVVAVTLAIVELSMKQLELSVNSVDSELAFQAANAGMECARYWRQASSSSFETGVDVDMNCFGVTNLVSVGTFLITLNGSGDVFWYKTELTWGAAPFERCSQMDIISMVVPATSTNKLTVGSGNGNNSLKTIFPGYPSNSTTCDPGGQCTIMSVTGYSSSCINKNQSGTQRREILLEF